jgi:glucose dehydrogenase
MRSLFRQSILSACVKAVRGLALGAPLVIFSAFGHGALAQPAAKAGEWPTYGGDLASSKYSPLAQIDRANFGSLKIAWRTKSPDAILSMTTVDGG